MLHHGETSAEVAAVPLEETFKEETEVEEPVEVEVGEEPEILVGLENFVAAVIAGEDVAILVVVAAAVEEVVEAEAGIEMNTRET